MMTTILTMMMTKMAIVIVMNVVASRYHRELVNNDLSRFDTGLSFSRLPSLCCLVCSAYDDWPGFGFYY